MVSVSGVGFNSVVRYRLLYGVGIAWFLRKHFSIPAQRFPARAEVPSGGDERTTQFNATLSGIAIYKLDSARALIQRK